MQTAAESAREARSETKFSATLELPNTRPLRDVMYLSHLFAGLFHTFGHPVVAIEKPGTLQVLLRTERLVLKLRSDIASLYVSLEALDETSEEGAREAEYLLARFIGTVCTVLHPVAIRWQDSEKPIDAKTWVARVAPVRPRRVRPKATTITKRPSRSHVAVWPNRPWDNPGMPVAAMPRQTGPAQVIPLRSADDKSAVYASLKLTSEDEPAPRREPLPVRACSWILTGVTTALFPPAGASLAVVNLAKGSDIWLSIQALAMTIAVLGLYQTGALADLLRAAGF